PHSALFLTPFFFYAPAPTEIYTLSLHDALPIFQGARGSLALLGGRHILNNLIELVFRNLFHSFFFIGHLVPHSLPFLSTFRAKRSEEHTSELQSRENLVCRLLLEKKKNKKMR